MQVDSMLLDMQVNVENANKIKALILERLVADKEISLEKAIEYDTKWQVIIFKKSWFKRWMSIFSTENKDGYCYRLVRFEE